MMWINLTLQTDLKGPSKVLNIVLIVFAAFLSSFSYGQEYTQSLTRDSLFLSVLEPLRVVDPSAPFIIPSYRTGKSLELSAEQFDALQLEAIFGAYDVRFLYKASCRISFSEGFEALIISLFQEGQGLQKYMVTYAKCALSDFIQVYGKDPNTQLVSLRSFIIDDAIYVDEPFTANAQEYSLSSDGQFIRNERPKTYKHFRHLGKFRGYVYYLHSRTVAARKGADIFDAEGQTIGKARFGETFFVVHFPSTTEEDQRLRVVIDPEAVPEGEAFYVEPDNVGYMHPQVFFDLPSNHMSDPDDEIQEHFGSYFWVEVGTVPFPYRWFKDNEPDERFDLSPLLQVERLEGNPSPNDIQKSFRISEQSIAYLPKTKGRSVLHFENGDSLVMQDTTYNSEYSPTRSFLAFRHPEFESDFMTRESMFFSPDVVSRISSETGDTLDQFQAYPHLSPSGKYSVEVSVDSECMQQTYLRIKERKDNRYQNLVHLGVASWSYPFVLQEDRDAMDEFELYWLSDDVFVLKVKNPEECYPEEFEEVFYVRYTIGEGGD